LNPDFDLFDCQEHFFDSPDPDHMAVKINWRINRPNGQFYERSDVQTFYADAESPAIMHNNGNEYLHYQDDWYIPGFKKGEYVFVYYKGTNDAWDGYGGAVVYRYVCFLVLFWETSRVIIWVRAFAGNASRLTVALTPHEFEPATGVTRFSVLNHLAHPC
jgi:hypothetical protein|tara:strand:+ start:5931 stop:6410 length:480 start_codon:yes stop_codon:yes gene_type:complete